MKELIKIGTDQTGFVQIRFMLTFKVGEILEHSHLIGLLEEVKKLAGERWKLKKSIRYF